MSDTTPRRTAGFSLIELLIVMAIMLIVAATAVPSYLQARAAANEAAAASSVRAIITAQNLYRNTFGVFTQLSDLGSDYLTDDRIAFGSKSGYYFESTPGTSVAYQFTVQATPVLAFGPSATGQRRYFGDESAVVRFNTSADADINSPPLQ